MAKFMKFGNTDVDVSQIAAVAEPDKDNVIKIRLAKGGKVDIAAKGKSDGKKIYEAVLAAAQNTDRGKTK